MSRKHHPCPICSKLTDQEVERSPAVCAYCDVSGTVVSGRDFDELEAVGQGLRETLARALHDFDHDCTDTDWVLDARVRHGIYPSEGDPHPESSRGN